MLAATTVKKTAFLATPGFVQDPGRYGNADLLKAVGANSGNLLFQYAAAKLIGGKLEHVGFSGKGYGDASVFHALDHFIFPAANHLRHDADWTLLSGFLKKIKAPLIVLGLGAQADHGADPKVTAAKLRGNASVMELVEIIRTKASLITVRGKFSEAVCHELGLVDMLRIGCQSQFISADKTLGVRVARAIEALKADDRQPRLALTASAPNELQGWRAKLEDKLFQWAAASNGIYVQQSCEEWFFTGPDGTLAEIAPTHLAYAHRLIAPSMERTAFAAKLRETFHIYFDARRWIEDLRGVDLAIGTRIHGNMAALAASKPGILVVHDARVTELADEMNVPRVEGNSVIGAPNCRDVLRDVVFDGAVFDAARRQKAASLRDALAKVGVLASDHLDALAA